MTFEARTDASGLYRTDHGITDASKIMGMTVAIKRSNGNWHTMDKSDVFENRFWWNDESLWGQIKDPAFANGEVRIVLFLSRD